MSEASIRQEGGELWLSGELDYRSGPALRAEGGRLIRHAEASELLLDCSEVRRSSSVGLALLLAFMRDARDAGKNLAIRRLPGDMRQIAQVSGLVDLLPLRD